MKATGAMNEWVSCKLVSLHVCNKYQMQATERLCLCIKFKFRSLLCLTLSAENMQFIHLNVLIEIALINIYSVNVFETKINVKLLNKN